MHPLALLLLAIFIFVQGLEYLGYTFSGNDVVKGLTLCLAGLITFWFSL